MKVKSKETFIGIAPDGDVINVEAGQVFEMPDGVDWIKAGLVYRVGRPPKKGKKDGSVVQGAGDPG